MEAERYQPFTLLLGSGQQDLGLVSQSAGVWLSPGHAARLLCRWCLWAFPGLSPQMTTSDGAIFHQPFPSSPSALSNSLAATRAFRDGYLASGSVVLDAIGLAAGGKNVPGLQDHTAPCSLTARRGPRELGSPSPGSASPCWERHRHCCGHGSARGMWFGGGGGGRGCGMGWPWRSVPTSVML